MRCAVRIISVIKSIDNKQIHYSDNGMSHNVFVPLLLQLHCMAILQSVPDPYRHSLSKVYVRSYYYCWKHILTSHNSTPLKASLKKSCSSFMVLLFETAVRSRHDHISISNVHVCGVLRWNKLTDFIHPQKDSWLLTILSSKVGKHLHT